MKFLSAILIIGLFIGTYSNPVNFDDNIPNKNPNLFEGDIVLTKNDKVKGVGITPNFLRQKWPGGVVPYEIDPASGYDENHKNTIRLGMDMVEEKTRVGNRDCIRFVPRTNEATYLSIFSDEGCYSQVGKQSASGPQKLSLKKPGSGGHCVYDYIVAHELIHALGFHHEQSRPDRDDYIDIKWENIPVKYYPQFSKMTTGVDTMGFPYDLYSIMHYDAYDFSNNGQPTIVSKDPSVDLTTFKHNSMTDIDIGELRKYYGCS